MEPGVYRLNKPLLGIMDDGARIPLTVPMNAEVLVVGRTADLAPLVNVRWGEKEFVMFVIDLERDSERISSFS